MKKLSKSELIRRAMHYAIQDRDGMAEADPGPYGREAAELAKQFRAYLLKEYGEEPHGDITARLPSISIVDIPVSSQDGEGG